MKKFIFKNTVFLAGICLLSMMLVVYKLSTENAYSILFHLKNKQLAKHATQNKVIILGGSNARYGFDSEYLKQKLNKPVINMAITIHQGLSYYLDWSKAYAKEGDWLIISPEYRLTDSKNGLYGSYMLVDVAPANKHFMKYIISDYKILKNQLLQSHMIISQSISSLTVPETEKQILLATHNTAGDAIGNYGKSKNFASYTIPISKPSAEYIHLMKEFVSYCQSKNIKVFFSFPPVSRKSLDIEDNLQQIVALTKKDLPGLILLNTPEDTIYPDSLFYDSSYHLNTTGKKIHTEMIYTQLKEKAVNSNSTRGVYTMK